MDSADDSHLLQYSTPQPSNSFKRPRRSLQSNTPLGNVTDSASPSPRLSGGVSSLTPEVIDHINGLKHLDDKQILLLLEAARNGGEFVSSPLARSLLMVLQIACAFRAQAQTARPCRRSAAVHLHT